jgi:hypothetical protein
MLGAATSMFRNHSKLLWSEDAGLIVVQTWRGLNWFAKRVDDGIAADLRALKPG